jgi:tetratricopeptide (TPR) repeat protein
MVSDLPEELVLEGIRELSRGNQEAALEAFGLALEDSDDPDTAALCAARLGILRMRFEEAERRLGEVLERRPYCVEALLLLGIAQRGQNRIFDALGSYREALRLDGGNERAAEELRELLEVQEP